MVLDIVVRTGLYKERTAQTIWKTVINFSVDNISIPIDAGTAIVNNFISGRQLDEREGKVIVPIVLIANKLIALFVRN